MRCACAHARHNPTRCGSSVLSSHSLTFRRITHPTGHRRFRLRQPLAQKDPHHGSGILIGFIGIPTLYGSGPKERDTSMASPAVDYARSNQQRFLNELKDLLRIPSISTAPEHKSDVQKAADYVANELRRIG